MLGRLLTGSRSNRILADEHSVLFFSRRALNALLFSQTGRLTLQSVERTMREVPEGPDTENFDNVNETA